MRCTNSAYAAACGMKAHVYMPADVPMPFRVECSVLGFLPNPMSTLLIIFQCQVTQRESV